MPVKIIKGDGERFHLIFQTKWRGEPVTLGVSGAPQDGFGTMQEAKEAKRKVSILKSGGITSATILL